MTHIDTEELDAIEEALSDAAALLDCDPIDQPAVRNCVQEARKAVTEAKRREEEFTEALTSDVPGVYVVCLDPSYPPDNVWAGMAPNPVAALSLYAVDAGFVEYESQPQLRALVGMYAVDEEQSRMGACANFTNEVIYAVRIAENGRCDECGWVLEPLFSDVDGSVEFVCPTHGSRNEYVVVEPWIAEGGFGPRYVGLTREGREYASAHGHESTVATVALQGYFAGWPLPYVRAAIKTMNEEGAKQTKTWEEKRDYLKEYASLLYEVGSILIDREPHITGSLRGEEPSVTTEDVEKLIWEYLYANLDSLYTLLGQRIDSIETEIFG